MKESTARDILRFSALPKTDEKRIRVLSPNERTLRIVETDSKKVKAQRALKRNALAFVTFVLFLMGFMVYSRMELAELRSEINGYTGELAEALSVHTSLSYQLESSNSLRDIELYAVNELGLVKLNSSQIEYVSLNAGNSIDIHQDKSSLTTMMKEWFSDVVRFFGGGA